MSAVHSCTASLLSKASPAATHVVGSSSHPHLPSLNGDDVEVIAHLNQDNQPTSDLNGQAVKEDTTDSAPIVSTSILNTDGDAFETRLLKSITVIEEASRHTAEHALTCHHEQGVQSCESFSSKMTKDITLLKQILSDHRKVKVDAFKSQTTNTATTITSMPKNTFITPLQSLPLFQWKDHEFSPKDRVFASVHTCLRNFEDVMASNGSKTMDKDYLVTVPSLLSDTARTWYTIYTDKYQREHKQTFPTFALFKTEFIKRFDMSESEERHHCNIQLGKLRREDSESVETFIERFLSLRERAGDEGWPNSILIDRFGKALPLDLYNRLQVHMIFYSPEEKKNDLDYYVEKARYFHNRFDLGRENLTDSTVNKRHHNHDNDSFFTDNSSTTAVGTPINKRRKHSRNFKTRRSDGKWCAFHQLNTHDTSNCIAAKVKNNKIKTFAKSVYSAPSHKNNAIVSKDSCPPLASPSLYFSNGPTAYVSFSASNM